MYFLYGCYVFIFSLNSGIPRDDADFDKKVSLSWVTVLV